MDLSFDAADVNAMLAEHFPGAGASCADVGDGWALASTIVPESAIRPGGFVSGPTQFALADAALWYLAFTVIDRIEPMALTSEMSIRFLRPAHGRTVWARAELATATRRSIVGSVAVWTDDNDDRPSSVAQGTYVLPRTPT